MGKRFRGVENVIVVLIAAVFLTFPLIAVNASKAGLYFPDWIAIGNTVSTIEGRAYVVEPELTAESFAEGAFQTQSEKWLSDIMPMRDGVILANAAMQRRCIEMANLVMRYDCYPTYFDSSRVYTPRIDTLTSMPAKTNAKLIQETCDVFSQLHQLASDYPDTQFVVYVVQINNYSPMNPAFKYISNAASADDLAQALSGVVNDIDNVTVLTDSFASEEDYYNEFYHTDHHWNSLGAVRAFNEMADISGVQRIANPKRTDFEGDVLIGSLARWGLCIVSEPVFDLEGDGDGLVVIGPDGNRTNYSHSKWLDNKTATRKYRFHDDYYEGAVKSGSIVENEGAEAQGSAILVCDSYGADLVPMLGERFKTVAFKKHMHSDAETDDKSSLRSILEQTDPNCVYIVAGCMNYYSFAKRSPNYFK